MIPCAAVLLLFDSIFLAEHTPHTFKGLYGSLLFFVPADLLFHPGHVVPTVKFITAPVKLTDHTIAHAAVEADAVHSQIFVILPIGRTADTGIHIEYPLLPQSGLQRIVKLSSDSTAFSCAVYVD